MPESFVAAHDYTEVKDGSTVDRRLSNRNKRFADVEEIWTNTANGGLSNTDNTADHMSTVMTARVLPAYDDKVNPTAALINHFSSIYRLKRSVIWLYKYVNWRRNKAAIVENITVDQMRIVHDNLIRYMQRSVYSDEYQRLKAGETLPIKNQLYYLEPKIDGNGIMRVGGRLKYADIDQSAKNQILIPADHHVTLLLVRHMHHVTCLHSGVEHVLATLRAEYWIPRARPLLRRILRECMTCRRLGARAMKQKMADLPPERLAANQRPFMRYAKVLAQLHSVFHVKEPFTCCGNFLKVVFLIFKIL